jgi:purine catabolism regulator
VSEEIRAFGRMSAMQRFLMDAIGEEDPKATIIERLASLIKARVGLLMPTGEFEIATAALPGPAILAALGSRSALSFSLTLEGLHGHAFPVGGPGGTELPWLVIAGPEQQPLHPLAKAAGNATLPLLAAMSRLDQAQRMQEEAARRATLDALLEADGREESRVLAAQAAVWGLDLGHGVAIVVAEEAPGEGAGDPERLLARIESSRAKTKDSFLATVRDGKVCALLPAPVTDGRVTSTVLSAATGLRAGVGRVVTEPTGVLKSFSDAELALEARSEGSAARISRYDDLDLGTVLVRELPLARLAPKIEQWLEPLLDNPRVYETLVAYFKHNLDVGRTAQALHLHPNSVRYRLSRAEAIIGAPVRSPTTMIAVHVAMMSDIAPSDGFNGV